MESDTGNGPIRGFQVDVRPLGGSPDSLRTAAGAAGSRRAILEQLQQWSPDLAPLAAGTIEAGGAGADVDAMVRLGVLGIGVNHDTGRYFDIHHTRADTFEKVDLQDFRRNAAAIAVMAWRLANTPGPLLPWAGDLPEAAPASGH